MAAIFCTGQHASLHDRSQMREARITVGRSGV